MCYENQTTTIFWPDDIRLHDSSEKYVTLGYRINKFKVVVIDIVERDCYKDFLLNFNSDLLLANSKYVDKFDKLLIKKLEVLGCINFKSRKLNCNSVNYNFEQNLPDLNDNENLVYFRPPKSWKLEYYSIDPISINIFWNLSDNKEINFNSDNLVNYKEKMINYHWLQRDDSMNIIDDDVHEILRIVNLTNYIRSKIYPSNDKSRFAFLKFGSFSNDIYSILEPIAFIFSVIYYIIIIKPCHYLNALLTYRFFRNIRFKSSSNFANYGYSLVLLSFTLHQINFKLKQLYSLPSQFKLLKFSKIQSEASILKGTKFSPSEYIKFYNTVWLILHDIFFGLIFSSILKSNNIIVVSKFQELIEYYDHLLNYLIFWLMNNPAGFKLNNELTSFMGQLISWVLSLWQNTTIRIINNNFGVILKIFEILTKFFGFSLFISLLLDILHLLVLNLLGFYIACTRLYCWQLNIIKSLFKLFYGKKYNVLRNRVDSNDYEFDQLLLGIIIFTILIYLFPTVFLFYVTFSLSKFLILTISNILKIMLILFNHMPVVVLLLKFKNQDRLPAGILLNFNINEGTFDLISKSLTFFQILKSHINSMLNYNYINVTNEYHKNGQIFDVGGRELEIKPQDVIDNWSNLSLISIVKKMIFGETVNDIDYQRMF